MCLTNPYTRKPVNLLHLVETRFNKFLEQEDVIGVGFVVFRAVTVKTTI